MSSKFRHRMSKIPRHRIATALDLQQALIRTFEDFREKRTSDTPLPPQAPRFLKGLPKVGQLYEPKWPATIELKNIIETNYYGGAFSNAIQTVGKQHIPELRRIKTLDQFYFFVDALVTWIPEIRVWDWDGEFFHERTVYLRITQFYYYFNQPELEALQSPVAPLEGQKLSPISEWLRNFAVEWGSFLDTPASCAYLESFKYAPEYAWQDYEYAPEDYSSFNAYFARTFKDINVQRPVARAK